MLGFIVGALAGMFAGSWVYWRVRGTGSPSTHPEWLAATAAGLVAALVASAIFIRLQVHIWLGGAGTSWAPSLFLGVCSGLFQGVLFRGRPLGQRLPPPTRPPDQAG